MRDLLTAHPVMPGTVPGMTLHIPHGFVVRGAAADLFALPAVMRGALVPAAEALVYDLLGQSVAEHVDRARAGLGPHEDHGQLPARPSLTVLGLATRTLERSVRAASDDQVNRSPQFDLGATVKVLAHPHEPGALLLLLRAERGSVYGAALAALDGFEDFSYYSCERPPIGRPEWDARQDVWKAALNGPTYLSDLAWSWSLLDRYPELTLPSLGRPDVERVVASAPDLRVRTQLLARARVVLDAQFVEKNSRNFGRIYEATLAAADELVPSTAAFVRELTADDLLGRAQP